MNEFEFTMDWAQQVYLDCYQEYTPFLEKWEDAAEFGER